MGFFIAAADLEAEQQLEGERMDLNIL